MHWRSAGQIAEVVDHVSLIEISITMGQGQEISKIDSVYIYGKNTSLGWDLVSAVQRFLKEKW